MRFSKKGETFAQALACTCAKLWKWPFKITTIRLISSLQLSNMVSDSILFIALKYFTSKLTKTFFDIRLPTSFLKNLYGTIRCSQLKWLFKELILMRDSAVWKTSFILDLCAVKCIAGQFDSHTAPFDSLSVCWIHELISPDSTRTDAINKLIAKIVASSRFATRLGRHCIHHEKNSHWLAKILFKRRSVSPRLIEYTTDHETIKRKQIHYFWINSVPTLSWAHVDN